MRAGQRSWVLQDLMMLGMITHVGWVVNSDLNIVKPPKTSGDTEHSPKGGTTSMNFVNGFQSYHKESKLICTKIFATRSERNELQDMLNKLA